MQDLADHIISLLEVEKEKQNIMFHRFPIKSICEIDVIMTLEFLKEEKIIVRFLVDSQLPIKNEDTIMYSKVIDTVDAFFDITQLKVLGYLQEIIDIIPTLKLDKFAGALTDEFIFENEQILELFKFENTVLKYDTCCVCQELCGTTTACHHHLCIACFSKLAEVEHECEDICDECGTKKCPICRKDFYFIIKT